MQEQRHLPALRAHINQLLSEGWVIAQRNPLKLQLGSRTCLIMHGMLISEGTLWNHADAALRSSACNPQPQARQTIDAPAPARAAG
ncbi:hypothetical protein P8H27_09440 [Pseudomonas sp. sp1636]|uniref:hypothetical protein n=1 Tax=Pseudomonas sp. sp1636 TaxID=3036707 RepID=UPI0025A5F702|nr:hypothetical protein [Pseudomonas sp. sp1636]MDM8349127.1 hypothetical protein [Pseudomonas sp. sp1636]